MKIQLPSWLVKMRLMMTVSRLRQWQTTRRPMMQVMANFVYYAMVPTCISKCSQACMPTLPQYMCRTIRSVSITTNIITMIIIKVTWYMRLILSYFLFFTFDKVDNHLNLEPWYNKSRPLLGRVGIKELTRPLQGEKKASVHECIRHHVFLGARLGTQN